MERVISGYVSLHVRDVGCPPSLLAHVRDRLNSVPAVRWVMMKTGLDFLFLDATLDIGAYSKPTVWYYVYSGGALL